MYYRKGTDQHLTFLRNMREAHAMYPFTGKRDKELFDKALAELFRRLPILRCHTTRCREIVYMNIMKRLSRARIKYGIVFVLLHDNLIFIIALMSNSFSH
uniref:Uncharacterized protein n=1 Tax=Biomphalaria glabrata TaxID=6526 RepID=A0A2C9LPN9_BIOGL